MIKRLLLITFFIISSIIFAQEKREILYGKVVDSIGILVDAHVVNLNTNQGTFTNTNGVFRLFATTKDSLQISSVGYTTLIFMIRKENFGLSTNQFMLTTSNYELKEVVLKNHNLTGVLALDIKLTPKDTIGQLVKDMVNHIKKLDYNAIATMDIGFDEIHLQKVKLIVPNSYQGATLLRTRLANKSFKEKYSLKKKLDAKITFPNRVLALLNKDFFFKELQIPKEKYYHFIDYCSYKNIEKLFKNEQFLELIRIFKEESILYLKLIKDN